MYLNKMLSLLGGQKGLKDKYDSMWQDEKGVRTKFSSIMVESQ